MYAVDSICHNSRTYKGIRVNSNKHFIRVCKEIHQKQLVVATGGNISMRIEDSIYITPSGYPLGYLEWENIVEMNIEGSWRGTVLPSKEYHFHLGIYKAFPDVHAVVHIHSFYSNCVAALLKDPYQQVMPAYTANYIKSVGKLPVVPFRKPGTTQLSDTICEALNETKSHALILQNHGIVSTGKDILEAFYRAEIIEENAHFHMALSKEHGRYLTDAEIAQLKD